MKAETRVLPEETESYGKVYHLFLTQEAVFGAGALTPYVRQLILESKTPTDQVPSLICQYFCSSSGMPSHRYKCAWADPNQTDEVFHCELTVDTCQEAQAKSGL